MIPCFVVTVVAVMSAGLTGCFSGAESDSEERVGYVELIELDSSEEIRNVPVLVEIRNDAALAPIELDFDSADIRVDAINAAARGDFVVVRGYEMLLDESFGFSIDSLKIISPNNLPGTVPSAR